MPVEAFGQWRRALAAALFCLRTTIWSRRPSRNFNLAGWTLCRIIPPRAGGSQESS
jgi:hypothetical protein